MKYLSKNSCKNKKIKLISLIGNNESKKPVITDKRQSRRLPCFKTQNNSTKAKANQQSTNKMIERMSSQVMGSVLHLLKCE